MIVRNQPTRDRNLQVYLAQARGPTRNGDLLRQSIDRMLQIRHERQSAQGPEPVENALIETLTAVTQALDEAGAVYAVTGSIASSIHGEPWMSEDVDLIILASRSQAVAVASRLSPRFYAPDDMLSAAAADHAFSNVVDNKTGLKADLSFIERTGYLARALSRRVRTRIGTSPGEFWVVTPEDVILMKLLWRRETRSAKQWENALGVARVRGARMDWAYLWSAAEEIGVKQDLAQLRDEAGI